MCVCVVFEGAVYFEQLFLCNIGRTEARKTVNIINVKKIEEPLLTMQISFVLCLGGAKEELRQQSPSFRIVCMNKNAV